MAQCKHCFLDLDLHPALADGACPNCGRLSEPARTAAELPAASVAPVGPGAVYALFARFWTTARDVIFSPTRFFSTQAPALVSEGGISSALAFAVIIQWLASFFNFVWSSTAGVLVQRRIDDIFRIASDIAYTRPGLGGNLQIFDGLDAFRHRLVDFLFGAGAIVLTPFTTLMKLAFTALLVHAAVRFFTSEAPGRRQSYAATLKILAFASAPWVFCVIPGFGMLLGWVLAFSAGVIGLREVYKTTTGRAVLAVSFPALLFSALLFVGIVLVLFLAFNVMRLMF